MTMIITAITNNTSDAPTRSSAGGVSRRKCIHLYSEVPPHSVYSGDAPEYYFDYK